MDLLGTPASWPPRLLAHTLAGALGVFFLASRTCWLSLDPLPVSSDLLASVGPGELHPPVVLLWALLLWVQGPPAA